MAKQGLVYSPWQCTVKY